MTIIFPKTISKIYFAFLKVNKGDNVSLYINMTSTYEDWKPLKLVCFHNIGTHP